MSNRIDRLKPDSWESINHQFFYILFEDKTTRSLGGKILYTGNLLLS